MQAHWWTRKVSNPVLRIVYLLFISSVSVCPLPTPICASSAPTLSMFPQLLFFEGGAYNARHAQEGQERAGPHRNSTRSQYPGACPGSRRPVQGGRWCLRIQSSVFVKGLGTLDLNQSHNSVGNHRTNVSMLSFYCLTSAPLVVASTNIGGGMTGSSTDTPCCLP